VDDFFHGLPRRFVIGLGLGLGLGRCIHCLSDAKVDDFLYGLPRRFVIGLGLGLGLGLGVRVRVRVRAVYSLFFRCKSGRLFSRSATSFCYRVRVKG
jgi:hypothetical protein